MKKYFSEEMMWTFVAILGLLLFANILVIVLLTMSNKTPATGLNGTALAEEVSLRVVTAKDCTLCPDAGLYQQELTKLGVNLKTIEDVDKDSVEGKKLIKKYELTKLPALIFSKELSTYGNVVKSWSRIGTIAKDGSYLLQGAMPPYYDISSKEVKGLVSLTYLNDSSCTKCYDVTIHSSILKRLGLAIKSVKTVDVSSDEGKALIDKYDIKKVPTIIIQGNLSIYPNFDTVWKSVGSVVNKGYVFTNLDALKQPYKVLATGELVTPKTNATVTN